jgi:membrane-associated phospholipid phosphatase
MLWVEGVELNSYFSFPSGHATAAFSMCLALAIIVGKVRWSAVFAVVAALLAYSRVYLSQHFLQDIMAGAALGTVVSFLVYLWLYRSVFAKRAWLARRVVHPPK